MSRVSDSTLWLEVSRHYNHKEMQSTSRREKKEDGSRETKPLWRETTGSIQLCSRQREPQRWQRSKDRQTQTTAGREAARHRKRHEAVSIVPQRPRVVPPSRRGFADGLHQRVRPARHSVAAPCSAGLHQRVRPARHSVAAPRSAAIPSDRNEIIACQ